VRLKPRLADFEWRRKSPHFIRERGTLVHGIHFQASQFGSADSGTFTINLVVTEPRVYRAWCGRPLPANPATALYPVQERIGRVDSKRRDHWWDITASTNISDVEIEVFGLLQKAEELFFPQFMSLEAMLDRLRTTGALPGLHGGQRAVVQGVLAAVLGHTKEAERVLRDLAASSTVPGFTRNVTEAAKNVGITI
jgi:hypothetical protein